MTPPPIAFAASAHGPVLDHFERSFLGVSLICARAESLHPSTARNDFSRDDWTRARPPVAAALSSESLVTSSFALFPVRVVCSCPSPQSFLPTRLRSHTNARSCPPHAAGTCRTRVPPFCLSHVRCALTNGRDHQVSPPFPFSNTDRIGPDRPTSPHPRRVPVSIGNCIVTTKLVGTEFAKEY